MLAVPAFAILALQFFQFKTEKANIETETSLRAKQVLQLTDSYLESNLNALRMLASRNSLTSQNWPRANEILANSAALNPYWRNILIIDLNGNQVVAAYGATQMPHLPNNISGITVDHPIIGDITSSPENEPRIFIYARIPVMDEDAHYILAAGIEPSGLQEILLESLPSETIAAIVDPKGTFAARWPNYETRVGKQSSPYLREAIRKGQSGIYHAITLEGFDSYTAYYVSPDTGWSAHVAIASSLIDTPRLWASVLGALGTALAFLIAGGLALYSIKEFESDSVGQLGAIVASSDDAIVSKNLDGIIQSWNSSAERIFGYTPHEAIGKHISLIIPTDRMNEETEIISKVRSGQRISHYETIRHRKDGTQVHLSLTVSPVKDKKGRIIGASKVARDITERKQTETELREEREGLATLNRLGPRISSTLDLHSLVQLATDEATKVTGAAFGAFFYNVLNEDGQSYLLYTLSGAPQEAFSNFGMPRATEIFSPTFKGEGTVLLDDVTKDPRYGKNKPHHGMPKGHLPVKSYLAVPVISRTGEIIGGMFFGHPEPGVFTSRAARIAEGISGLAAVGIDNARLYDEVRQGQKRAEDASRAKTDFLATMSHEIRTPMNAIMGLTSILSMSSPLTEKQKEYVTTLRKSSDTLLQLINDLLDITQIESRSIELERTPFSLAELLDDVVQMMLPKAQEKALKFNADTEAVAGQTYIGDPARLRQVMINLCSNALKFTDQGSISLRIYKKHAAKPGSEMIAIEVSDTGIGIPADKQQAIFDKFVQADTSINRRFGGTGLGLTITRKLVELMGGQITVESEPKQGSVFTVTLPLDIEQQARKTESPETILDTRTPHAGRILLVEDNDANILVATTFLEMLGYPYDTAHDGKEAVDRIFATEYALVLMDIQMPGMSGFDATRVVRDQETRENMRRLPIIGLTAHALEGYRELCISKGMDGYLPKPFNLQDLKSILDSHIKG